jgi:hypothetical protein
MTNNITVTMHEVEEIGGRNCVFKIKKRVVHHVVCIQEHGGIMILLGVHCVNSVEHRLKRVKVIYEP